MTNYLSSDSLGSVNVTIVGAGLAGPLLAQGLVRAGVDVSLYEREAAVDERSQGYRIHLDPAGDEALRACLPPELYEQAKATAGVRGSGMTILDPQLNTVRHFAAPPSDSDAISSVDRLALRRTLLTGLDVHYGTSFERYELVDGRVRTFLSGGAVTDADLLVAADGTHSRIRQQLLPQAEVVETGQFLIFGKTPLTAEARAMAPPASLEGFSAIAGTDGRFMPLAAYQPRTGTGSYLMWVVGIPAARRQPTDELLTAATRAIADWHPNLQELIRLSDPLSVSSTMIRTANPVPHWPTVPVTLVGDAIHTMVPAGIGAAVALRDAALLCRKLTERDGALLAAVSEYETDMLDYGFAAVARSLRGGV